MAGSGIVPVAYGRLSSQSGRTMRTGMPARAAPPAAAVVTSNGPLKRLMERIVSVLPPVSTTIA
jgi:hypothetical protein